MSGRIAWIGTGLMGVPMARRLLDAGWDVAVWNRTPERTAPLVAAGATRLDRLADAAAYEAIGSIVLDDAALDRVAGPDGFLGAREVATRLWVECSTVSVAAARRAAAAASGRGVGYVSAPISGNPGVVERGTAVFAASGDDPAAIDAAERVLLDIGERVTRVGAGATANIVKLATNAVVTVTLQSLVESVLMADQQGVDRRVFLEFLADSVVGSSFVRYKTDALADLDFTRATAAASQLKDTRLALAAAHEVGVPQPVLEAAERQYARLVDSDLDEGRDLSALLLLLARDAGIDLAPRGGSPTHR